MSKRKRPQREKAEPQVQLEVMLEDHLIEFMLGGGLIELTKDDKYRFSAKGKLWLIEAAGLDK